MNMEASSLPGNGLVSGSMKLSIELFFSVLSLSSDIGVILRIGFHNRFAPMS